METSFITLYFLRYSLPFYRQVVSSDYSTGHSERTFARYDTNAIPKAPSLVHTLGALGPMPQAAPHLFQRAAEVVLGVSFNAQAPDIPGASSRALLLRH
jgi:hypothetical protein